MTSEEALALIETTLCYNRRTKRGLNALQRTVFRYAWEDCSYGEMARQSGYELSYVKQAGSQLWQLLSQTLDEKVTKHNVQLVLRRNLHQAVAPDQLASKPLPKPLKIASSPVPLLTDWGDAVDVSCFHGREAELSQLTEWILIDRCRLVGIFGMGGIGKTALSIRLAQSLSQQTNQHQSNQHQSTFSYILWRSLRNAPPLSDLITDLIQTFSPQQAAGLPQNLDQQILHLLNYLRQHRCLIVLDNGETVMSQSSSGGDLAGYDAYESFWQQIGQTEHQSTILLTSREKPKSMAAHDGKALPIRSLRLTGLPAELGQTLFDLKGDFNGTALEWQRLVDHYAGNPLALKMVAAVIQELFDGQVGSFLDCLQDGTAIFGDIQDLLSQQISRLSVREQQTLDWLAIARKPITLSQLRANFTPILSLGDLLVALSALERRCLIEKLPPSPDQHQPGFTLQPVVMEYLIHRLIDRVCEHLLTQPLSPDSPLASHALIQAQAKDYIRETQTRLILKPIADRLLALRSRSDWEQRVRQWLDDLRQQHSRQLSTAQLGYRGGNLLNLLTQMQIDLSDWDFSQLPVWNAYLKGVTLQRVNFTGADLAKSVFSETFSQVLAVAFSPDGKLLATGDVNHEIQLWQVSDGKPLLNCRVHEGWIWSVAFSPDGKLLASSANRAVHLWDVQTGVLVQSFSGYSDRVFSVAFSPDGHLLATGSEDHCLRIWDLRSGSLLHQLSGHTDEVRSVAFSVAFALDRQTLTLASASYDGTVRLWDAASGSCLHVLTGHPGWVWSVAFSPDGRTLASGGAEGCLKLWQVKTGRCVQTLNAQNQQIRSLAFSPDGRSLASGSDDGNVRLWNYQTGELLKLLSGHTSWIAAIAFSADHLLASGSEDRSVRLWQGTVCLRRLQGYSNGVWSAAFSPSGQILASGSQDRLIRLWSAQTGQLLGCLAGHTNWIWSIAFSPTQSRLASASEDRTIRIWDLSSQRQLHVLEDHRDAVLTVLYSPDGSLWSSSLDGTVKHWTATGICLKTLTGHRGGIWSMALSLDGKLLLTGSQDQTLKLWDTTTGMLVDSLSEHQSWIRAVAISPDRQVLLSGSTEGLLKLWRLDRSGQYRCEQTYAAHPGPVLSIAIHKNGQMAVTSGTDRTIKLWHLQTGACAEISQAHQRWVKCLTYSPDGLTLASCSQDESIKLWQMTSYPATSSETFTSPSLTPTPVHTIRIPRPYEGLNITQSTGLTAAQQAALKQLGAVENPG